MYLKPTTTTIPAKKGSHNINFIVYLLVRFYIYNQKKKEENTQLVFERESVQLVQKTIDLMLFLFVLWFCSTFFSLFLSYSSCCLFYSPTVNVQLHTTWADNKGVFQWKTHSFPLDSSRHLFNTEQHVSTAPFQSLVLWREKLAKNRRERLKSRDFGTPSFWWCSLKRWDELHHQPTQI